MAFPKSYQPEKSQPKPRRLFSFSRPWPWAYISRTGLMLQHRQHPPQSGRRRFQLLFYRNSGEVRTHADRQTDGRRNPRRATAAREGGSGYDTGTATAAAACVFPRKPLRSRRMTIGVAGRRYHTRLSLTALSNSLLIPPGGSVAEWLACWTQAQKGPGSDRSRDAVG